jgi:2-polyprenyl-3-methyl-5-hydroxy-6-metoxy-1,4-benzoquinol methylase
MGKDFAGTLHQTAETFVARLMRSKVAVGLLSIAPIPLFLVRSILARDNARENRKDSWQRLRGRSETARYGAVRRVTERYAQEGFVLDIGCSQGILQEGLTYGRYLGVDNCEQSILLARPKCDRRTQFVCADGFDFVADQPPNAVVMNEVIYYLPDPIAAVEHHARRLARGGVVIVSIYARTWYSRRLLRALGARLELVESNLIRSGHLAWTVAVYRPLRDEPATFTGYGRSGLTAGIPRPAAEASPVNHLGSVRTLDARGAGEADPSTDRGIPPDHEASRRRR